MVEVGGRGRDCTVTDRWVGTMPLLQHNCMVALGYCCYGQHAGRAQTGEHVASP